MNKSYLVLILFCLVFTLFACTPSPRPQSAQFTQVAFVSSREGNPEVFVMNANGSGQVNVTNSSAMDASPHWSPDGNRVIFVSNRDGNNEIYSVNTDGSGLVRLTKNPADDDYPVYSPDGKHIVFGSDRERLHNLYVMNPDGSGLINVSQDQYINVFSDWSPDGKKLAFLSSRDGNYEVYVVNVDGSGLKNLTNNSALDAGACWSPDGRRLAFETNRDGSNEIYVMNADGSQPVRLTNNSAFDFDPFWSPDGKQLIFTSKTDQNREIYLMRVDGSNQVNLTQDPADDYFQRWTKDGKQIIFMSNREAGGYNLFAMNSDGTGVTRLTKSGADSNPDVVAASIPLPTLVPEMQTQVAVATPAPTLTATARPWFDHLIGGLQGNNAVTPDLQPTGLAVAPDGTLFVATAAHSYIFHIDPFGKVLAAWGGFQQVEQGQKATAGLFNQPAGIALTPDGFVFIADLWNHRIQKFTQDGKFVLEWGTFGQGNDPYQFWGPRGLAVDSKGHLLVVDSGNKRVVVYDSNGKFISQIGGLGKELGQFDEPIGVAVDSDGTIYVGDYWNARIQVLKIDDGGIIMPKSMWYVDGWGDNSLDYKPYICLHNGHVFAPIPAHNRVLEYASDGTLLRTFDIQSSNFVMDGIPTGVASDSNGGVWVSDLKNNLWYLLNP